MSEWSSFKSGQDHYLITHAYCRHCTIHVTRITQGHLHSIIHCIHCNIAKGQRGNEGHGDTDGADLRLLDPNLKNLGSRQKLKTDGMWKKVNFFPHSVSF